MESLISIIAIGGGLAIGPVIVAIVMWFEYRKSVLRNKERMAAIEKGIPLADLGEKPEGSTGTVGQRYLRRGIMLLFIGTGLAGALYMSLNHTAWVWGAFVAFIGLGNLFYWFVVGRNEARPGDCC